MSARYWKTRGGVLVREVERRFEVDLCAGHIDEKILGERVPTGGSHGWLWLKNLTAAKPPKRRARK